MAPRLVAISAVAVRIGYLWHPQVSVDGFIVYKADGYASYSKALADARSYARNIKLECMR